jgi:undecaprenyl-diphosphatase
MRDQIAKANRNGAPIYFVAIACLLFVFGVVAQFVAEGKSSAFDRSIVLAFRDPGNPSAPIGPAWVQEAARDLTSLGSIIVLVIITAAVAGYLFLARKRAAAWLMLFAVFGGIALSDLLKFAFAARAPISSLRQRGSLPPASQAATRHCRPSPI